MTFARPHRVFCLLAASTLLAACAGDPVLKDARELADAGQGTQALVLLEKASRETPENPAYRSEYFRQRELLVAQWLSQAETLRLAGQFELAEELYRRVIKFDAQNPRARAGQAQIEADKRHRTLVENAEKLVRESKFHEAQTVLRPVLVENPNQREARRLQRLIDEKTLKPAVITPQLRTTSSRPILLELRDVPLRAVFDVISRASGVNFVFDRDVRIDQKTSIAVRDAMVEELIRLVLASNQLEQKIVNETTVLVFPNTPQKLREHQELVVKSFYLANADAKQTANMIRTLVKSRDIFIDEKLNMIVIKDTPNAIRLAEKLITAQDLAEPEVMLEVEVLEIGYSKLLELGLRFPDSVAWSLVGGGSTTTTTGGTTGTTTTSSGTPGTLSLSEWINRNAGIVRLTVTNPLFLLSLKQQDGTTSVLANPRIRVKNKEKAKVHIGDRVPVITTTAAVAGGFVSESVSYLDIGLKLEVEPLIYLEDEVGIKMGLEVSNIVKEIKGTTGTLTYQIGTRNASTVLRVKDGETQILAGLISDEDRRTANRVPGVGELPIVGRLFSSTRDTIDKKEIVLLMTPRLVRTLARPEARAVEFAAGTEAVTGAPFPAGATPPPPAFAPPPPPPAPFPPAAPPASELVPFGGMRPGALQ
ncbi:MAG: secretin N-terminal domain-containing protein [Burkholderiales bacterium]